MLGHAQISAPTQTNPRAWQVCNETSYILNIAIASIYEGDASGEMSVQNWQKLRAGKCLTAKVKRSAPRYVYARSNPLHQGGIQEWKGQNAFCISPVTTPQSGNTKFNMQSEQSCRSQDMISAQFLRVIPTEKRTAFIEPNGYGKKAETAGLQRLLQDNNYKISRIDGISGRRTSNTLRTFLKDKKLKSGLTLDAKLDALEAAALASKPDIGVHLCNDSDVRIWSALAWRISDHWESQGWWPVEPKTCAHPFTRSLKGAEVFLYARLETNTPQDLVLKSVSTTDKNKTGEKEFCIGSSSFSAVSHEYCRDQGYISAKFRPLPNNKSGVKLNLASHDFTKPSLSGLR